MPAALRAPAFQFLVFAACGALKPAALRAPAFQFIVFQRLSFHLFVALKPAALSATVAPEARQRTARWIPSRRSGACRAKAGGIKRDGQVKQTIASFKPAALSAADLVISGVAPIWRAKAGGIKRDSFANFRFCGI